MALCLSDPPLLYGPRPRAGPAPRLTDREREVLQHIAESKVNKEIGAALSISANTVETRRKRIMEKLDLHKTAGLVRFAMRKRIVT